MKSIRHTQQTVHFLGNLLTFRARTSHTGDTFTVIEVETAPGAGAPPHTQTDQEAFLILEGCYEITTGGTTDRYFPGDFVHVEPGVAHAFRSVAEAPSRMLLINFPGDLHQRFFDLVGEKVEPESGFPPMGQPDIAGILDAAGRCGITMLAMEGA